MSLYELDSRLVDNTEPAIMITAGVKTCENGHSHAAIQMAITTECLMAVLPPCSAAEGRMLVASILNACDRADELAEESDE